MSEIEKIYTIKDYFKLTDSEIEDCFGDLDVSIKSVQVDSLTNFIEMMEEYKEEQRKINKIISFIFVFGVGLYLLLTYLYVLNK